MEPKNNPIKPDETRVKVTSTLIKYCDPDDDVVHIEIVVGRLNITESKEYVNMLGEQYIYISKESFIDTFTVDTIELLLLKK